MYDPDQWQLFCSQPREEPSQQSEDIECACAQWLRQPHPRDLEVA